MIIIQIRDNENKSNLGSYYFDFISMFFIHYLYLLLDLNQGLMVAGFRSFPWKKAWAVPCSVVPQNLIYNTNLPKAPALRHLPFEKI